MLSPFASKLTKGYSLLSFPFVVGITPSSSMARIFFLSMGRKLDPKTSFSYTTGIQAIFAST